MPEFIDSSWIANGHILIPQFFIIQLEYFNKEKLPISHSLKTIYFWLCWVFVAACGLSLVVVRGLLTVVASLVVEQGF